MRDRKKDFGLATIVIVLIVLSISGIIYFGIKAMSSKVKIEEKGSEILRIRREVGATVTELNKKLDKISNGDVIPEKHKKILEMKKEVQRENNVTRPKKVVKAYKRNGVEYEYYSDGTVKSEKNYIDGLKDGREIEYYSNGKIKREINYINGLKNGKEAQYYPNGIIAKEINYDSGIKNGKFYENYENGNVKIAGEYNSDKLDKKIIRYN
ncbi:toxin-antitoxin system YwqK family antitoxin, partial [Fusobacterium sp.]|uniref:toxin-antitoxin system YwqK family antitoxin n=1 Tax=Fusobacterium sp. TaxID=68766 RepID=UPI00345C5400